METKDNLIQVLNRYGIQIITVKGQLIELENNYEVEIETNGIYKLRSEGLVIAPFADLDELCQFIKMG